MKRREVGLLDSRSRMDPVEQVYDHRIRGVGVIMVQVDRRMHAHAGCWFMLASLTPPTLMVAIPNEFAARALIPESGRFTVSLAAEDQVGVVDQFFSGLTAADEFAPGTLVTAPSGQPALGGSPGVFDCAVAGHWDLGDFLLVAGGIQAAGGERPHCVNLTVNAIQARTGGSPNVVLPRQALAAPSTSPPPVALNEAADTVYARRRFGPMLLAAGSPGAAAQGTTRAAVQVSHDPPRFLWSLPEHDALTAALTSGGGWSLTLTEGDRDPDAPGRWVDGARFRWADEEPLVAVRESRRPYFAGVGPERLESPTLPHDALWLARVDHFGEAATERSRL